MVTFRFGVAGSDDKDFVASADDANTINLRTLNDISLIHENQDAVMWGRRQR